MSATLKRRLRFLTLGAAACWTAASVQAAEGPPLVVKGGWVREEPAGATALRAYLVIENNSLEPQSIVLVEAQGFARVEMQRTAADAASGSRPVDQLDIPMFGRRVLEPFGEFLLLAGAKRAYRAGDRIVLTFQLADGKQQTATLPVRRDPEN